MAPKWGSWGVKNTFFPKKCPNGVKEGQDWKKVASPKERHPLLRNWCPQGVPKDSQNRPKTSKIGSQSRFFLDGVLDPIFHGFWVKNGSKNQWKSRRKFEEQIIEAEGRIKVWTRRKHCKYHIKTHIYQKTTNRKKQKNQPNKSKKMTKLGSKNEGLPGPILVDFWLILESFWCQNGSKTPSRRGLIF